MTTTASQQLMTDANDVSRGMSTSGTYTQGQLRIEMDGSKDPLCRNRPGIGGPRERSLAEAQAKAHQVNRATVEAFAANVLPIVRQIQAAGVSGLQNIANALNDRGVRTARGGAWHNSTVRNLLARA
jgi:hypothetical protein